MNWNARTPLAAFIAAALTAGCVGPTDNPSNVKDLRVLGMSFEPPELMAADCDLSPLSLATFSSAVTFTALIVDPKGQGRALDYEILACADLGDRTCSTVEDTVQLAQGTFSAEAPSVELRPGIARISAGALLLQRVVDIDTYRGLGGIRMPVVLHLRAGTEEIFAQKLMVFSCRRFPEMRPSQIPRLRGINLNGTPLPEGTVGEVLGRGPLRFQPDDFSDREEVYYVSDFSLQRVQLTESWKIGWFTDFGTISPTVTGGADFGRGDSRHLAEWHPDTYAQRDVNFWFVVRNGRGGESWTTRRVHYLP